MVLEMAERCPTIGMPPAVSARSISGPLAVPAFASAHDEMISAWDTTTAAADQATAMDVLIGVASLTSGSLRSVPAPMIPLTGDRALIGPLPGERHEPTVRCGPAAEGRRD